MIIESCGNKIKILDEETGFVLPYSPESHRSGLLAYLLATDSTRLEDLIWPDMPAIRTESLEVIRQYLEYDLNEFINQTTAAERAAYEYAKMQLEPSDLSASLDAVLDDLIATDKIRFATDEDVADSIVPAPVTEEDFANLPIEDSRHPLNNIKVEIK